VYISSVLKLPKDQKVYVIGMAGLEEELREEGVQHVGGTVCYPAISRSYASIDYLRIYRIQKMLQQSHLALLHGKLIPLLGLLSVALTLQ
jgi:ribonucleotide monophosphatase NagD (HAD superfamily)